MFLRGYGSQAFSQNNGIVAEGGNNTTYKSGEVGKIQGDASRHWKAAFGSLWSSSNYGWYGVFGINATASEIGVLYVVCPTNPSQSFGAHVALLGSFPRIKLRNTNENLYDKLYDSNPNDGYIRNGSWTELGQKFAEDHNLCTSDKQNIQYTYDNVSMDYYLDSKRMLPTDNEIRPVNIAVRYYIKAK